MKQQAFLLTATVIAIFIFTFVCSLFNFCL